MKIKNTYIATLHRTLCLALLPMVVTACLYEHPTLTEDGELGVDPTAVTLNTSLKLNLNMPAAETGATPLQRPSAGEAPAYRHRFVVDAYIDRVFATRQIIYQDIADGRTEITLPLSMKLHARNYEIAVWSDYVQTPTEAQSATRADKEDDFYNIATPNHLLTVVGSETYSGCNEYKDVFCGSAELKLEKYRNDWNTVIPLELELTRPVARYQLMANDVAKFLNSSNALITKSNEFVARLKYTGYLNMGYNVLEKLPRHGLMYMQFDKDFKKADLKAGEDFPLVFDYFFASSATAEEGEDYVTTRIPVTFEIWDKDAKNLLASTSFNVTGKPGQNTTITYGFLTADPNGGVNFDPGYDGNTEIEIPAQPAD